MNNNTKHRFKQTNRKTRSSATYGGERKSKHAKVAWQKGDHSS